MAERKSGPVKPPVIDLQARQATPKPGTDTPDEKASATATGAEPAEAAPASPDAGPATSGAAPSQAPEDPKAAAGTAPPKPEAPKAAPPGPPPPRPQARLAMPWSAISIAAVAGALLGAALIYLLATWLPLPNSGSPIADPAPQLAALAENDAALEQRLAAIEEQAVDTQLSLDATIEQLDAGLAGLRRALEEVRTAMPESMEVELSGIAAQLQTLESRLDATAAGASSSDAAALADNLAGIEQSVADLDRRLESFGERLTDTESRISEMTERLTSLSAAVTAQSSSLGGGDVAPATRLPLIVSGLEAAFATGRPFAVELQSLTELLPDLTVPPSLAEASETGLPRPDVLVRRFNERLPQILAGRTATATGDLADDVLEWGKALLALRPAEEMEGDSPEAVISRLEAAMERRDFVAAARLMSELPAPMREAAGELPADILLQAEADAFITGLRAQALSPPSLSPPAEARP